MSESRRQKVRGAACVVVLVFTIAAPSQIREDQWHLRFLEVAEAHRHSLGDNVTVAVVDTGVDRHPDLQQNLTLGADMVGTGDGQEDSDSHGTGMAGLIAAHGTTSGEGALGIAPRSTILPVRISGPSRDVNSDLVAAGIEWAIGHGATVINASLAGSPSPRLRQAVNAAGAADVVIVAPAGNRPTDLGIAFPAAYDGVLAVGAVDRQGNHAAVSVTGRQVALSAPGVDIYSTSYRGLYRKGTGTSDAAAIVSGAVALVRSRFPELSAPEVVHRLTATAVDKGAPGRDEQYGYGVLDLVAALTADVPALGSTQPPATTTATAPPDDSGGGSRAAILAAVAVLAVGATALLFGLLRRRRERARREP